MDGKYAHTQKLNLLHLNKHGSKCHEIGQGLMKSHQQKLILAPMVDRKRLKEVFRNHKDRVLF